MLTSNYLLSSFSSLKGFDSPADQILQGNGYDGIIDILENMRGVVYPCVILETASLCSVRPRNPPDDVSR